MNEIYDDMLEAVYERQYETKKHLGVQNLKFGHFQRVLEEISLTVWHGNGRKATLDDIVEYCEYSNLDQYLRAFQEGASGGVSKLLAAFYFRQSTEMLQGEKSFEFTHKSFGEYLIAKRVVRLISLISSEVERNERDPDLGLKKGDALERWLRVCGETSLDKYILAFLEREIKRQSKSDLENWHSVFSSLLGIVIKEGSPIQTLSGSSLREIERKTRNSEETLLVCLNHIAHILKKEISCQFNQTTDFGTWLKKIQGQRDGATNCLAYNHLSYLNLSGALLYVFDFFDSNLKYTNLSNASMNLTICIQSSFEYANLSGANFFRANLKDANFRHANLMHTRLEGVDFEKANLEYANLEGANLEGANLKGTILDPNPKEPTH